MNRLAILLGLILATVQPQLAHAVVLGSIGDFVFEDVNGNGIQDGGEPGIENVVVNLLDGSGTFIDTTVTDVNGLYAFTNLAAGNYIIEFVEPSGLFFTVQDQGSSDELDSDADPTTGRSPAFTLSEGATDNSIDAGLFQTGSIGDLVFEDLNGNGIQDGGEPGVAGVTVNLLDSAGTNQRDTTTTGGSGNYSFTILPPGDYIVEFMAPSGSAFTAQDQGNDDAVDSDADESTGRTGTITLASGEDNTTVDAGLFTPVSIGDLVFEDVNGDGIQDAGDLSLAGVTVNLRGGSGVFLDATTTDADGLYAFSGLAPGNYIVEFVAPSGLVVTLQNQGSDDTVDSDADPMTGRTGVIALSSGMDDDTVDAGMLQLGVLSGRKFRDLNLNNTEDAGEPPLSSVVIELVLDGGDGMMDGNDDTVVDTQMTDVDGQYQFNDVAPGTYFVREIVPLGFMQMAPLSDFYTVAVESGTNQSNLHFGNVSFDFGDAPDPTYPTLLTSNGARHVIVPGFFLGTDVAPELNGQPDAMALGDEGDGNDDEDGVTFTSLLVTCEIATVDVVASDTGRLNAWVDFNDNGSWADPGEHIFIDEPLSAGVNSLSFGVPCNATATDLTFARFRLTSAVGTGIDGLADDGEVEDYALVIYGLDFGDAPDPTYPTVLSRNGARHIVGTGPHLGTDVDTEPNGLASLVADGDDIDGNDDEDGVVFTSILGTGQMATVEVTASGPGKLNAWIDFNDNGSWADVDEQVFVDVPLMAGMNDLTFLVPADATITSTITTPTFARFRFNTAGGLLFDGLADDGEVEDYEVEIKELECRLDPTDDVNPIGDNHTVTLTLLLGAAPVEGASVDFEVTDGPNTGEAGMGTTDADGRASFTYNGAGGAGTDTIVVRGTTTVDGKVVLFTCTATSVWTVRVISLEPTPGTLINRAAGVQVIEAVLSQVVSVIDIRIEGARQGIVTRGSLAPSGTDTLTFIVDPPLTVADRYTVSFLTDQGPIRWQFAVLVGDRDRNGIVNIFD